jgi:hypothetical protein
MTNYIVTGTNVIKSSGFMCVRTEWETLLYLQCGCENTTFICERRDKTFEIGVMNYPHFDRNSPTRIQ